MLSTVQLMIIIDGGIVNVALPAIQRDLGFSQPDLAWVVNAYLIAFGGLLLLSGRLGDLLGRKRVFVAGLILFTASSLVCGLATGQGMLVAGRFVQGVGGAVASAVSMGIVVTLFPEPRERAKAIGASGFVAAAGGSIGGVAGGVLTQSAGWHWIFFVNVPIGIVATVLAVRIVAADRGIGLGAGVDVLGAFLVTAGLMLGVFTIAGAGGPGGSARTYALGAATVVLLAAFALRQVRAADPLLPPRILRSRPVTGANLVQFLMVASMIGFSFLSVLYLQRVLAYDEVTISLAGLPVPVALAAVSLGLSARLIGRFGEPTVLLWGLAGVFAALALAARAPVGGVYALDVLPMMTLLGAGAGLAMPAVMTLAMSEATPRDAGLVSGLLTTSAQAGGALGLAFLAALATARTGVLPSIGGLDAVAALNDGYHLAFGAGAVLVAVAIVLTLTLLRTPAPPGPAAPGVPPRSADPPAPSPSAPSLADSTPSDPSLSDPAISRSTP